MSVEALAIALHHSRSSGTAKLILVGIANHDGDGGSWPSTATLAYYGGVSPDGNAVQKHVRLLESLGEVRRDVQDGGPRHMAKYDRPNLYHFLLTCPSNCDRTTKHRLLCVVCSQELKGADRERRHAAEIASHTPFLTSPVVHAKCPTPPQRGGLSKRTSLVQTDTRPLSERTPKPSSNETTNGDIENDPVVNREGNSADASPKSDKDASGGSQTTASAIADGDCSKRIAGVPHAYSLRTGRCVDCNAQGPSTGIEIRRTA